MSIYSNVTEQDLINLRKLAQQRKEQRAERIKNRILKQTHDIKIPESLSPITKKLDEVNKSSQKVGDIIKESNSKIDLKSLPNSSRFSNSMLQMLGSVMNSRNFSKITQDNLGQANILGFRIPISESDTIKTIKKIYDLIPEIYKVLTYATYTGDNMENENDILKMYNIIREVGYTGIGDKDLKRKVFFAQKLPEGFEEIQNKTFGEITIDSGSELEGQGVKIIIPSNIIDIYTRLEILLGLKLSGHNNTLTEASNLFDELYNRGEIQNKQQYRNAPNKFST